MLMAKAAKVTIVEAENIVEIGEIGPDEVDLPGIFVDRIVPATAEKKIEILKIREPENETAGGNGAGKQNEHQIRRERIGKRASKELQEGFYVNLGVGIPTMAANHIPPGRTVWLQSENGMLGMGPYPTKDQVDAYVICPRLDCLTCTNLINRDVVNAGKETVTMVPGASCFDSSESFGMIRGGHVDVSILGVSRTNFVPHTFCMHANRGN